MDRIQAFRSGLTVVTRDGWYFASCLSGWHPHISWNSKKLIMGNKKTNGYRIDGGEIEFVAKHPKDHTLAYVKAVREACYRRYNRSELVFYRSWFDCF